MFEVILSASAKKFYDKADSKLVLKLNEIFEVLSFDPFKNNNIKKLKGKLQGLYRFRTGNYRIVYSIENEIKIVSIIWIGKRKDIY